MRQHIHYKGLTCGKMTIFLDFHYFLLAFSGSFEYDMHIEVRNLNKSIGKTLSVLRRAKSFMQKDVASKLSGYGVNVSSKTIYNWEKGLAQPNADQFLALCDILGVDDVMWQFSGAHKGPYAGLNQAGRKKAREFIDLLMQIDIYRDDPEEDTDMPELLRLYDIPVSAGSGNLLDESSYELIKAPVYVPAAADFALRVSGDSMEPMIRDGQIIWIKEQKTLGNGEIGVFTYDGNVYCKELVVDGEAACLRSLNPEYEDIAVNDDFGFQVIGRVIA